MSVPAGTWGNGRLSGRRSVPPGPRPDAPDGACPDRVVAAYAPPTSIHGRRATPSDPATAAPRTARRETVGWPSSPPSRTAPDGTWKGEGESVGGALLSWYRCPASDTGVTFRGISDG